MIDTALALGAAWIASDYCPSWRCRPPGLPGQSCKAWYTCALHSCLSFLAHKLPFVGSEQKSVQLSVYELVAMRGWMCPYNKLKATKKHHAMLTHGIGIQFMFLTCICCLQARPAGWRTSRST